MDNSGRGGTLLKLGSVPEIGEIRSSKQLGYSLKSGKKAGSFSYAKYVWLACPTCGKERWVRLTKARKPNYKGFCKDCRPGKGRPSREELLTLYWDRGLSCRDLARRFDVGRGEAKSWFKQYGIRLRTFPEAQQNRRRRLVISGYNPDFANVNGEKKLIELFGEYYHSTKKIRYWHETELGRLMAYNALGFNCLIIWEHELKDPPRVIAKIRIWSGKRSEELP